MSIQASFWKFEFFQFFFLSHQTVVETSLLLFDGLASHSAFVSQDLSSLSKNDSVHRHIHARSNSNDISNFDIVVVDISLGAVTSGGNLFISFWKSIEFEKLFFLFVVIPWANPWNDKNSNEDSKSFNPSYNYKSSYLSLCDLLQRSSKRRLKWRRTRSKLSTLSHSLLHRRTCRKLNMKEWLTSSLWRRLVVISKVLVSLEEVAPIETRVKACKQRWINSFEALNDDGPYLLKCLLDKWCPHLFSYFGKPLLVQQDRWLLVITHHLLILNLEPCKGVPSLYSSAALEVISYE